MDNIADKFSRLSVEEQNSFLARLKKNADKSEASKLVPGIVPIPGQRAAAGAPLSYSQRRLWFLDRLADGGDASYNIPAAVRFEGKLDIDVVRQALSKVLERHDSLRTRIVDAADANGVAQQPYQVADAPLELAVPVIAVEEAALMEMLREYAGKPFDLTRAPLFDAVIFKLSTCEHVLFINMHHIISDGWSMEILKKEFLYCYRAAVNGAAEQLPALQVQYGDFACWQQTHLGDDALGEDSRYWEETLRDLPQLLELPTSYPRPSVRSGRGAQRLDCLMKNESEQLEAFSKSHRVSLFVTLLSVFNVLLYRYTGARDIVVGTAVANRLQAEISDNIGLFVNTLVLRNSLSEGQVFSQLLDQVNRGVLAAYGHQQLPFEKLVDRLQPERSLSHSPLFQVMLVFQDFPLSIELGLDGLCLSEIPLASGTSKFDLTVFVRREHNGLGLRTEYSADLFSEDYVERFIAHYKMLLRRLSADPGLSIDAVALVTEREQHQQLIDWNGPRKPFNLARCLQQPIIEQVERTPDAVAVIHGSVELRYRDLYRRALSLAHRLCELRVQPNELVAVVMERGWQQVVAVLAILISGAAYLPVSAGLPPQRRRQLLELGRVSVAVTEAERAGELSLPAAVTCLTVDESCSDTPLESIAPRQSPQDLAYVIFTSGSTGVPKGVAIQHANVLNTLLDMNESFSVNGSDAVLALSELNFDLSVYDIFGVLMAGGRLVIPQLELARDPQHWLDLIRRHRVSLWNSVPALMQMLVDYLEGNGDLGGSADGEDADKKSCNLGRLRTVWMSGDWIPPSLPDRIKALDKNIQTISLGGATEASIWSIIYPIEAPCSGRKSIPYGRALTNQAFYVLNEALALCPPLVAGDLYIGGAGLAREYWGDVDRTKASFITHPRTGQRLYRTGDRGRWLPEGEIEFLGRLDNQVKLRGFRIELGEIEATLKTHGAVDDALVVINRELHGGEQLVAYITAATQGGDLAAQAHRHLQALLPGYMVPRYVEVLERFPLTANGKVDRKALPLPRTDMFGEQRFVAPRTPLEKSLAQIWGDVLGLERVGVYDNFFQLGGDSILSIQIVNRARRAGIRLSVRDIFKHQVLADLCQRGQLTQKDVCADQNVIAGDIPLTPVQAWFFEQCFVDVNHFNQAQIFDVSPAASVGLLTRAIDAVVKRHDVLRLRFTRETGAGSEKPHREWRQRLLDLSGEEYKAHFECVDFSHLAPNTLQTAIEARAERLQRSLNISKGPLLKILLIELEDNKKKLLVCAHHLVIDGVSWRILLQDFETALTSLIAGNEPSLGDKTCSYRQWSEKLNDQSFVEKFLFDEPYWLTQLQKPVTSLPRDKVQRSMPERAVYELPQALNPQYTRQLIAAVPEFFQTKVDSVLIAALFLAVQEWSGEDAITLQMEGHGREDVVEGIVVSETLGWFTSLYPVVLELRQRGGAKARVDEAIVSISEQLAAIPHNGFSYGLLKYLRRDHNALAQTTALTPDITFNYLGQFDRIFGGDELLLSPAEDAVGRSISEKNIDSSILAFNLFVKNGCLQLRISYAADQLLLQTIETLAENYIQNLRGIVSHCETGAPQGRSENTFSRLQSQSRADSQSIETSNVDSRVPLPLSFAQQRLWFLNQLEPESTFYNITAVFSLAGELKPDVLVRSVNYMLHRHEILRTRFLTVDDRPVQAVEADLVIDVPIVDCRDKTSAEKVNCVRELKQVEGNKVFDLRHPPLIRITAVHLSGDEFAVVVVMHHIISDAWSMNILESELRHIYARFTLEEPVQLPALKIQYRNFAQWHRRWLQGGRMQEQLAYWRQQLQGAPTTLDLPLDKPRPALQGYRGLPCLSRLPKGLSDELKSVAANRGCTLNMVMLSAFYVVLWKYTDQDDMCIGVPILNRHYDESLEHVIGFFINTLVIRGKIVADASFTDFLYQIRDGSLEAYDNQDIPFDSIVEAVAPKRTLSHSPLIQVFFNMLNVPENRERKETELFKQIAMPSDEIASKFDLNLYVKDSPDGIGINLVYNSDLFFKESMEQFLQHFENLLMAIVAEPDKPIRELALQTEAQRQRVVEHYTNNRGGVADSACIHKLFEAQVEKTPDAKAVVSELDSLTYRELNTRANRIAHRLMAEGIKKGDRVAVFTERSPTMVVAILAVLKSGAAYVPIDPQMPRARIRLIWESAAVSCIVTDAANAAASAAIVDGSSSLTHSRVVDLSHPSFLGDEANLDRCGTNPDLSMHKNDLAQIIYTSGSTGVPKGVMIPHRAIVNRVQWMHSAYPFENDEIASHITSINFVRAVWELFVPLCNGVELHIVAGEVVKDAVALANTLGGNKVTRVVTAPSLMRAMLDCGSETTPGLSGLKHWFVSGEPLSRGLVSRIHEKLPSVEITNLYGATEIGSGYIYFPRSERCTSPRPYVPIGWPISKTSVYILDKYLNIVPQGIVGELAVGGENVSYGYLGNKALTASKYIPDPFSGEPGSRLFKTGDLARYGSDGSIEFIGRADFQVKIRGYRIEPGEIESALLQYPQIQEAVVTTHALEEGNKVLCAYYRVEKSNQLNVQALRSFLNGLLPDYMVPTYFIEMDTFVLKANGKIDRKALPDPKPETNHSTAFRVPQTPTQKTLAAIWCESLKIDRVGVNDDFFLLGGHSLVAAQVRSRIKSSLGVELSVRALFEQPRLIDLAAFIDGKTSTDTLSDISDEIEKIEKMTDEEVESFLSEIEK